VLRRGQLIGRIDAKAHRAAGLFELKSVAFESGVRPSERLLRDLAAAVARCARWHGCPAVEVTRTIPEGFAAPLRNLLTMPQQAAA
jgi:uncharacterized protein YcaQ